MMELYAPHPDWAQVIFLPNPELRDTEFPVSSVQLKRAMDGTVHTTVRRQPNRRTREFQLILTRDKSLELLVFFERWSGSLMRLKWESTDIIGYLKVNPCELEVTGRAVVANSQEEVNTTIAFEKVV